MKLREVICSCTGVSRRRRVICSSSIAERGYIESSFFVMLRNHRRHAGRLKFEVRGDFETLHLKTRPIELLSILLCAGLSWKGKLPMKDEIETWEDV